MKIVVLMEDTDGKCGMYAEHGLSIYVETGRHRILVDAGASERTWENAARLGIDLARIDAVFLSHGHYDHSGGILSFAGIAPGAKIYMHPCAVLAHYNLRDEKEKYIGIDPGIAELPECVRIRPEYWLDGGLSVFGNVTGRRRWPQSNLTLKRKEGDAFIQDSFDHEQYVVVEDEGKKVLISGCAHNGILNILDRFRALYHAVPDLVVSGFHMAKRGGYDEEESALIRDTAIELRDTGSIFYTGHCTGMPAFDIMKPIMGDRLRYMHSGDRIL